VIIVGVRIEIGRQGVEQADSRLKIHLVDLRAPSDAT
jgi:hypothetical protein